MLVVHIKLEYDIIVAEFQFSQSSYNVSENQVVTVCLKLVNSRRLTKDVTIEVKLAADDTTATC